MRSIPGKELPPSKKVRPEVMQHSDFGRTTWDLQLSDGHTEEDLLSPSLFDHKKTVLQRGQRIFCTTTDLRFVAEGIIVATEPEVIVDWYSIHRIGGEVVTPTGFAIKFDRKSETFTAIREKDSFIMARGFHTREAAGAWIGDNLMRTAAAMLPEDDVSPQVIGEAVDEGPAMATPAEEAEDKTIKKKAPAKV